MKMENARSAQERSFPWVREAGCFTRHLVALSDPGLFVTQSPPENKPGQKFILFLGRQSSKEDMEISDAQLVPSQSRSQEETCWTKYKCPLGIIKAGAILSLIGSVISALASFDYIPQYFVLGIICFCIGLSAIVVGIILLSVMYQMELLRHLSLLELNTTQAPILSSSETQTSTTTEDTT